MAVPCPNCGRLGNPIKNNKGRLIGIHHKIKILPNIVNEKGTFQNYSIFDSCHIKRKYDRTKHLNYAFEKQIVDCGRWSKTNNDCTVIALALACNRPYEWAHELLKLNGRKTGFGFHLHKVLNKNNLNFVNFKKLPMLGKTLTQSFKIFYPKGTYIVSNGQHCFVFKDGVAMGTWQPKGNKPIKYAYEVLPK